MRKLTAIIASILLLIFWARSESLAQSVHVPTPYTSDEIVMLAKTVWGEARGCAVGEQKLVIWTVLQRVSAGGYGGTIRAVLKAPRQFKGYRDKNPVSPEILELCEAETEKWARGEKPPTLKPYAPATPYFYFRGDGRNNWFREKWQ